MTDVQIIEADALSIPLDAFDGVDVQITDPPYSAHVHENMASHGTAGRGSRPRDPGFEALSPALRGRLSAIAGKVRRWSVVFSDLEGAHDWRWALRDGGAEYIRQRIWIRWSQPQLSGDRPPSTAEAVLLFHRPGAKHWNGPGSETHYSARCLRGDGKHPTEKPLDLMLSIVSAFSDPGESIVDPCAGAGTTALAARLLGRDCIAIERDPKWAAMARLRVSAPLTYRDRDRAEEWCVTTSEEAERVPAPKAPDGSDVKTWERAQRRLADVARVAEWL